MCPCSRSFFTWTQELIYNNLRIFLEYNRTKLDLHYLNGGNWLEKYSDHHHQILDRKWCRESIIIPIRYEYGEFCFS